MNIIFDIDILGIMPVKREKESIRYSFYFHLANFQLPCRLTTFFANMFPGGKAELLIICQINPK